MKWLLIWTMFWVDLLFFGWLMPTLVSSRLPSEIIVLVVFVALPSILATNILVYKHFYKGNHDEKVS